MRYTQKYTLDLWVRQMGAPLPEFLKKMIAVLKATVDTSGDAAIGDHEGSANN